MQSHQVDRPSQGSCSYFLFDEAPKYPPGMARLKQIGEEQEVFEMSKWSQLIDDSGLVFRQILKLLCNRHMVALNMSYGISFGITCAIPTLIDQMIQPYWPGDSILIGYTGVLFVLVGSCTLPFVGFILDASRKYLLANKLMSLGAALSLLIFGYCVMFTRSRAAIYSASGLIGVFQMGIMAASFELAVELMYPSPELITSTFMNLTPQIWTVPISYLGSYITDSFGAVAVSWFFFVSQLIGLVLLFTIRETLNRQAAAQSKELTLETHADQDKTIPSHKLSA